MASPSVTVIVPFYNAGATLGECLASIRGQSGVDFEVVMVDDGSGDGGRLVAESFALGDRRFRLLTQANSGVSAARNAGLESTRGEFVTFADADDVLAPGALAALLAVADEATDVVAASHFAFRRIGPFKARCGKAALDESSYSLGGAKALDGIDAALSTPWAKLYRSDVIKSNGLRFDAGVPIGEDTRFNIAFCASAHGALRTTGAQTYGYALGGEASSKRFHPQIMAHYAGLYDAYASSVPLFSEGYVDTLWRKFLDAGLLHIYAHCTDGEARERAATGLPVFLDREPRRLPQSEEAQSGQVNDPGAWLRDWELRNRTAILKSRAKRLLRGRFHC